MKRLGLPLLVVLGLLAGAAPAHAGFYNVVACGDTKVNESWTGAGARGATVKATCAGGYDDPMFVRQAGSTAMLPGEVASLNFNVPAGLALVDWKIDRIWTMQGQPASGFNRPFVMYVFNGTPFAGGGHYFGDKRQELTNGGAWASPPEGDFAIDQRKENPVKKATFQTSQAFGAGSSFSVRVGCVGNANCKNGASGNATNGFHEAQMTIDDTQAPALSVADTGLLSPGPHAGNEPITVTASDPSGIAKVELIDRSDPTLENPQELVNYLDNGGCAGSRIHQCPDIAGLPFAAPLADYPGTYPVYVRATDRAGNATTAGPYTVTVTEAVDPSERGAVNGTNATAGATLVAGFGKTGAPARSVRYGKRAPVGGRLVNNAGVGIANATLIIRTRDKFRSIWQRRGTVKTGPDGSFALNLRSQAARTVRISWRHYANDEGPAARAELKLDVRALATVRKPNGVRRGRAFIVRGQVQGANPRKGVRLVVQVKRGKAWKTVGRGRAGKAGKYALRARIGRRGAARLRVQVRGRSNWPYVPGASRTVRVPVR